MKSDRANLPTLFEMSPRDMQLLMQQKKRSRLAKNKDFRCYVLSTYELDHWLQKLKETIHEFPDKTRLQLAVYSSFFGHWFLIDFYLKDGNLCTFVLDANKFIMTLLPTFDMLMAHFPRGKHFANGEKIQYTHEDCQTFTRQQVSIISRIDPELLYGELSKSNHKKISSVCVVDMKKQPLLVPLLKGKQNVFEIRKFPGEVKQQIISRKQITLIDYVENHVQQIKKTKSVLDSKMVESNLAIKHKDLQYAEELQEFKDSFRGDIRDANGFGFVSLPIMVRVMPILQQKTRAQLIAVVTDLVSCLEKIANSTQLLFFQYGRIAKTKEMINQLQLFKIYSSNERNEAEEFANLVYDYAGYLSKNYSPQSLDVLNNFFQKIEAMQNQREFRMSMNGAARSGVYF